MPNLSLFDSDPRIILSRVWPCVLWTVKTKALVQGNCLTVTLFPFRSFPNRRWMVRVSDINGKQPIGKDGKWFDSFQLEIWCWNMRHSTSDALTIWTCRPRCMFSVFTTAFSFRKTPCSFAIVPFAMPLLTSTFFRIMYGAPKTAYKFPTHLILSSGSDRV